MLFYTASLYCNDWNLGFASNGVLGDFLNGETAFLDLPSSTLLSVSFAFNGDLGDLDCCYLPGDSNELTLELKRVWRPPRFPYWIVMAEFCVICVLLLFVIRSVIPLSFLSNFWQFTFGVSSYCSFGMNSTHLAPRAYCSESLFFEIFLFSSKSAFSF